MTGSSSGRTKVWRCVPGLWSRSAWRSARERRLDAAPHWRRLRSTTFRRCRESRLSNHKHKRVRARHPHSPTLCTSKNRLTDRILVVEAEPWRWREKSRICRRAARRFVRRRKIFHPKNLVRGDSVPFSPNQPVDGRCLSHLARTIGVLVLQIVDILGGRFCKCQVFMNFVFCVVRPKQQPAAQRGWQRNTCAVGGLTGCVCSGTALFLGMETCPCTRSSHQE